MISMKPVKEAFLKPLSLTLRLLISRVLLELDGDADTQAAIAGSIAEGTWETPQIIIDLCLQLLDNFLLNVVNRWQLWLQS